MRRYFAWAGRNADAVLALVLAVAVGVVGLGFKVDPQVVGGATLVAIGLIATSLLHDRFRQEPGEEEVRHNVKAAVTSLADLRERMRRMERLEGTFTEARQVLDDMAMVRTVPGAEVGHVLAEARRTTDRWIFRGGTGTYIRAVTLPECVAIARREKRTLLVRLEIVDPTDEQVCDRYARFRRSLTDQPDGIGEVWTLDRTRKEAFATILAACWYGERFGLLDIDVGLSKTMSTFRWDMSSTCVVITQEDPRSAAMMIERGRLYYDFWSTELQASLDQARRVPIEKARTVPLSDEPTVEEIRNLFDALGLSLPFAYGDRDVVNIAGKALRPKNPYD